jgi:hypothetical protein
LDESSLRTAPVRALERIEQRELTAQAEAEHRAVVSVRAAKFCSSIQPAVGGLDQLPLRLISVRVAEGEERRQTSSGSNPENGPVLPVGPAKRRRSVKIAVGGLDQSRIGVLGVGPEAEECLQGKAGWAGA